MRWAEYHALELSIKTKWHPNLDAAINSVTFNGVIGKEPLNLTIVLFPSYLEDTLLNDQNPSGEINQLTQEKTPEQLFLKKKMLPLSGLQP